MKTRIKDFAYYLPKNKLTNEKLAALNPDWDIAKIESKTGMRVRHECDPNETCLDMGVSASQALFGNNPGLRDKIDAVLFNTTTPDYITPQNACMLHERFDMPVSVFCLDLGMACSGFVYGMAVAQGLITTGAAKNILIVTAERFSPFNHPQDRATKSLFSDGAAATWITASDSENCIMDMDFGTLGKGYDAAWIPAGHSRLPRSEETKKLIKDESGNIRTLEHSHLNGKKVMVLVGSHVPKQVRKLLKRNDLTTDNIDLFIFHQGSKLVVDSLERLLRIPPEKHFWNYDTIGNTSSASIPIALKDAKDQKRLNSGDLVLVSGFGAGFSWGTAIFRY